MTLSPTLENRLHVGMGYKAPLCLPRAGYIVSRNKAGLDLRAWALFASQHWVLCVILNMSLSLFLNLCNKDKYY